MPEERAGRFSIKTTEDPAAEIAWIVPAVLVQGPWSWLPGPLRDGEFAELSASIEADGILMPLLIDAEGRVLDGNHRLRAALQLGLETVPCRRIPVLDERQSEAFVLRLQLGRRNLDHASRDEMIGRLYRLRRQGWGGDRRSQQWAEHALRKTDTAEEIGREFDLSPRSVKNAAARVDLTTVLDHLRGADTGAVLSLRRALKALRGSQRQELLTLIALHDLDVSTAEKACVGVAAGCAPAEAVCAAQRGERLPDTHRVAKMTLAANSAEARLHHIAERLRRLMDSALEQGAHLDEYPWDQLDAILQLASL